MLNARTIEFNSEAKGKIVGRYLVMNADDFHAGKANGLVQGRNEDQATFLKVVAGSDQGLTIDQITPRKTAKSQFRNTQSAQCDFVIRVDGEAVLEAPYAAPMTVKDMNTAGTNIGQYIEKLFKTHAYGAKPK